MSNDQSYDESYGHADDDAYGSRLPPTHRPPPPPPNQWWCNACRRLNARPRYQCQVCRMGDTFDLCDQCVGKASMLHPGHTFSVVP
ncbi:unnamed protein product [Rotaria sp. Silwood1]|nr:unnamed protein product [Rotaria sp. Silwood1]